MAANADFEMRIEHHTFRTPDSDYTPKGEGLWISAKRYTTPTSTNDTQGLTLLFTHCNGSHKEEWELVIARLFALQNAKPNPQTHIREAWSFDRQNHGDAAVLNARALELRNGTEVSLHEWALALKSFVQSPLVQGHRLVALGHSAGATAWVLTTLPQSPSCPTPPIPYASIICVEPTMTLKHVFEREIDERMEYMDLVVNLTLKRKDEWKDKDAAYKYFRGRLPWGMWDERTVRVFVDNALRPSPDVRRGVTLKWSKEQEAASYPNTKPHHEAAVHLQRICADVPIHMVWGARVEFMPEYLRDCLSDPQQGFNVASVSYIEDAGHMVVQEKPDALAEVLAAKLDTVPVSKEASRVVGGLGPVDVKARL